MNIRRLEELSSAESVIHRLHPLSKLVTTVLYLIAVTSCPNKEITGLAPFALFPVIVASLAGLPARIILKRLAFASPVILGIGILNPLFDRELVLIGTFRVAGGWLVFASLAVKCALTVSAATILVGTTGIDGIGEAMRILRIPRVIIVQFLLAFRYLSLLIEEVARLLRAHELRSLGRRGIGEAARGSLPGSVLVKTYERGLRIHEAMKLRGFSGEFPSEPAHRFRSADSLYVLLWAGFFFLVRTTDIPGTIGSLLVKAAAR
jgi:cobalt/nickel transport system permease protein